MKKLIDHLGFSYHSKVEPGQLWIVHDTNYVFREKSIQEATGKYTELERIAILKDDKFLILDTSNQSQKGRIKILFKQNIWYIRDIDFENYFILLKISKL